VSIKLDIYGFIIEPNSVLKTRFLFNWSRCDCLRIFQSAMATKMHLVNLRVESNQ